MNRMKLWMAVCFSAVALAAQPAARPADPPAGIPAGAAKAGDTYRFTDAQGRQWIYRQTPFGIARTPAVESKPATTFSGGAAAAPAQSPDSQIRAFDHGDTVSFERPGPFGVYRWERKKSQMDAGERAAFARQSAVDSDRK